MIDKSREESQVTLHWWKVIAVVACVMVISTLVVVLSTWLAGHPPLYVTVTFPENGVSVVHHYWLFVLAVMVVCGAFGGMLAALSSLDISMLIQGRGQRIGKSHEVIGALLVGSVGGIGGAVAVLAIIVADGKLASPPRDAEVLGLCALGITAGFVGFKLIKLLANRLGAEIETQIKDNRSDMIALTKRVEEAEKHASQMAALNAAVFEGFEIANRKERAPKAEIQGALERVRASLNDYPTDRTAGIIAARLLRNLRRLPEAIVQLTTVLDTRNKSGIQENSDTAALLFNRACYRNILADTLGEVPDQQVALKTLAEQDLLNCGKLVPDDLIAALTDDDLTSLRSRPKIQAAIATAKTAIGVLDTEASGGRSR